MKPLMTVDFSFYFVFCLALFSRNLDVYLTYLIAILIHECGHLLVASLYKWEVESFKLTALGGFLTFRNDLARPPLQSMVVALGGILFNGMLIVVLKMLDGPPALIYTQFAIIVFNLLPVTPLDGSKVFHSLLRLLFDYRYTLRVLKATNFIFLVLFTGIIIALRLHSYVVVAVVLAVYVGKFSAAHPYLYERYLIQSHQK